MGIITSRFRGNKSTIEILETLEKEISRLQKSRRQNQELQKKVAASLLLYSIVLYILAAVLFYFLYFPEKWQDRALFSVPLLVFPVLVWGARKLMHWYFVKRLTANDLAVNELREKKKLILEDVMEKETYKKAREILEKFDPARFRKLEQKTESPAVCMGSPGTNVRQRVIVQPVSPRVMSPRGPRPMAGPSTPRWTQRNQAMPAGRLPSPAPVTVAPYRYSSPPGPPMPRTVLPKDRGAMDKFIDYLVGDGPQNRYALICRYCSSHNGMALPEEFEYLSFRCCYCYNMNQARKTRPFAPRLEFPEVPSASRSHTDSSDTEAAEKKREAGNISSDSESGESLSDKTDASHAQRKDASLTQQAEQPVQRDASLAQQAERPIRKDASHPQQAKQPVQKDASHTEEAEQHAEDVSHTEQAEQSGSEAASQNHLGSSSCDVSDTMALGDTLKSTESAEADKDPSH